MYIDIWFHTPDRFPTSRETLYEVSTPENSSHKMIFMSLKSEQGSIGREDSERGGTNAGTLLLLGTRFMTRRTDKHKAHGLQLEYLRVLCVSRPSSPCSHHSVKH